MEHASPHRQSLVSIRTLHMPLRTMSCVHMYASGKQLPIAVASTHGCLGKGLTELLGFCAKQQAAWAGTLKRQSLQGAFWFAWESRVFLAAARAASIHAQNALVKLVSTLTAPKKGRPRSGSDPLLNIGVFPLREAEPPGWSDEAGESPFNILSCLLTHPLAAAGDIFSCQ